MPGWFRLVLILLCPAAQALSISSFSQGRLAGHSLNVVQIPVLAPSFAQVAGPPAVPAQEGYADLPGVRLWFKDIGGSGQAVVLLHANTGTSASWQNQYRAFSEAGYRVIAFDRRGWGKSVANPATGPQPGSTAEDLHNLADFLKLGRFHLVGVAGGGFVALDYAAWHPERIMNLVVGASSGSVQEQEVRDFAARALLPGIALLPQQYRELGSSYRGANPRGTLEWINIEEHAQQPGSLSQPPRTPNTYAKLERISVRTLVMPGDADLLAPPALMRMWGSHLVNAEWATVPDSGHSIAWEQPEIFNSNVLRFLKGCHGESIRSAATEAEPFVIPPCSIP